MCLRLKPVSNVSWGVNAHELSNLVSRASAFKVVMQSTSYLLAEKRRKTLG